MDSRRPAGFPWNYDRGEIIADGVIHALGICSGLIGAVIIIIIVIASHSTKIVTITSVLIYAAGLVAMLGFSAAYNMWPVSPTKWVLRRFDHSPIDEHRPTRKRKCVDLTRVHNVEFVIEGRLIELGRYRVH